MAAVQKRDGLSVGRIDTHANGHLRQWDLWKRRRFQ
jgi:hypothetical protein